MSNPYPQGPAYQQQAPVQPVYVFAGFWRRFFAFLIDAVILNIAIGAVSGGAGIPSPYAALVNMSPEQMSLMMPEMMQFQGAGIIITWLYFALLESSPVQATVGKMALGMAVTGYDAQRIGFGQATGRYFAKFVSAFLLGIGFLMVAFTARKQGLHDMIAGTLVGRRIN